MAYQLLSDDHLDTYSPTEHNTDMAESSARPLSTLAVPAPTPQTYRMAGRSRRFGAVAIRWLRIVATVLVIVLVLGGAAIAINAQREKKETGPAKTNQPSSGSPTGVQIVVADTVQVAPEAMWSLGIKTAEAKTAREPRTLAPLQGVLNVDHNRMIRVHSPFAGIVVALGTLDNKETDRPAGDDGPRGLRNGDRVAAKQLLAVVWSKDLGEKKSELVQAVSDLKLAKDNLTRYQSLTPGIIAEKEIRVAEANVRSAENAVGKAEATLRAWRLPDAEISALIAEAEKLGTPEARRELTSGKTWARVEVRSTFAGVILEKNTNIGDVIDTNAILFQVADLTHLAVVAQAYEDDLPKLQGLPQPIQWEIRLPSRPDFRSTGTLEQIGDIIDSTTHTAMVSGIVDNPRGELKSGQFVTAIVRIAPPGGEIEIPTAALVEDGKTSVVFVQPDPKVNRFVRHFVTVSRRFYDVAYLQNGEIRDGDKVVIGGALQLNQVLTDAPSNQTAKR
jgi:membrane fusion protein, heavy metal efflux system